MHAVVTDHALRRFVDIHHAIDAPPTVTLRSLADGALLRTIYDTTDPRIARLALVPPELVTLQSRRWRDAARRDVPPTGALRSAGRIRRSSASTAARTPRRVQNGWR